MKHVHDELARIQSRLTAYPDPFEHAGLYAAQQALVWALDPAAVASPFNVVTRNEAGSKDCSAGSRRLRLSNTAEENGGDTELSR